MRICDIGDQPARAARRPTELQASWFRTLFFIAVLAAGDATAAERKVLLVGLDGVRADALDAALAGGMAPNIQSLVNSGIYSNRATTSDLTGSWGGWSDVLRGVHRDEHEAGHWGGFNPTPAFPTFVSHPDLFTRLESYDSALNTATFITWGPLHSSMNTADLREFWPFFDPNQGQFINGDNVVTSGAVSHLSSADPDVVFFYQADPDISGHGGGEFPGTFSPGSVNYLTEIQQTDGHVGQVLSAIQSRPTFASEEWLVLLTSDHGGNGNSHSQNSPGEREVPFIVSGFNIDLPHQTPSVNPMFVPPKNIDILPTVLSHLQVPVNDAAWNGLRGHVIGEDESRQPAVINGANLVFNGDGEYDRGFNGHDSNGSLASNPDAPGEGIYWDQDVSGWQDVEGRDSMTVMYYGSDGGYPSAGGPGPADRGDNFFSAGIDGSSVMTQRIDVRGITAFVRGGGVDFDISAYLGGFSGDPDRAEFRAVFLDLEGNEIGFASVGPVTNGDRNNQTGLLFRESTGDLPLETAFIEFEVNTVGNDGYADNLLFTLDNIPNVETLFGDLNIDGALDADDWLVYVSGLGADLSSLTPIEAYQLGDLNFDFVNNHADFVLFGQLYDQENGAGAFQRLLSIPEPTTRLIWLIGGLALLGARRGQ